MKGEKTVRRSSFGSMVRKRLSDITNLHTQHRSPAKDNEKPSAIDDSSTKNYIEQLLKENAVMMKLIQDRDKIIETTGFELQKLRVTYQKIQLQNWQLAQANSQMIAELNMGKDRLKALQHEIACKDALYKAKTLELEEKAKNHCQTSGSQEGESKSGNAAMDHPLQANKNDEGKVSKAKRTRPTRSRSMGPTTSQQAVDKEMFENKRRCLRRQSVGLKSQQEAQGEMLEIHAAAANFPMDKPDEASLQRSPKASKPQRSSVGRPLRRAAEKVHSYKEPLLKVKMRRPE